MFSSCCLSVFLFVFFLHLSHFLHVDKLNGPRDRWCFNAPVYEKPLSFSSLYTDSQLNANANTPLSLFVGTHLFEEHRGKKEGPIRVKIQSPNTTALTKHFASLSITREATQLLKLLHHNENNSATVRYMVVTQRYRARGSQKLTIAQGVKKFSNVLDSRTKILLSSTGQPELARSKAGQREDLWDRFSMVLAGQVETGAAWCLLARKQRGTRVQHGNGWPGGRWGNRLSTAQAGQEADGETGSALRRLARRQMGKQGQCGMGWPEGSIQIGSAPRRLARGRWGNQLSVAWAGQRVLFKSVQHHMGWPDQDLVRHLRTTLAGQTTS
ncbi:hypothetical protein FIBSPDRAFT_886011 [Athelia psychrophila]|uniref:Uncharacterized protein n=1 Tax=Athelia psychrophila TaxID=1759441 RepID=A0A166RCJ6_9AGAM|nr:hypothetical protein FIBSPDRAFT_886011 [Fibularhizoctonia sp. CBS 109695]